LCLVDTPSHFFLCTPPSTPQRYSLSLHDALPISHERLVWRSTPSSRIENRGEVRFRPSVPDATEIDIDLYYRLPGGMLARLLALDRKSTRLNSSHVKISYAVFCLKKKIILVYTRS